MRARQLLPVAALLLLPACNTEPTIQKPSSPAINDAVNEVSANITEHDGAQAKATPLDPAEVGQSMRTAPATPPRL